jgi:ABC-2 type transport system ATP-binding protein
MTTAAAEFDGIGKEFRLGLFRKERRRALSDVSFQVQQGDVFGLVGPNRAGKTTLLKVLLSLCRPTAGAVKRLGQPLSDRRTLARVGFVYEHQAFPKYHTASGILEFYGAMALIPDAELRRRVPRLLEKVGLSDRARESLASYSKGMIARLALAQALINEPELLVLDEPAEGLDLDGRRLFREAIMDQRQAGKTTLLVSHVVGDVESLCNRLAVLVQGRLAYTGPVSGLTKDSAGSDRPLVKALQDLYRNFSP